jgi:NAD(P)H dehydrogenase (quinone)
MEWTILRKSLYADYQIPEASQARAAGALVHNRGAGKVAYVAREDCAAVAAAVLAGTDHAGKRYDVTGPNAYTARELAALYGELGARPVIERCVSDAELVAGIIGAGTGDDHLRYGAELVASFGRSIREGYMDARSDDVAKLTGRPPLTLRQVLEPLRAARS